jgi:hypothetical protein
MMQAAAAPVKPNRIASLDGVKGFLSLKIALAHVSFFVVAAALSGPTGIARMISFPVLLFAFGVGNGISKRKKPVYPLVILGLALLAGSVLNEAFLDAKVAHGFFTTDHPIPGGPLHRLSLVIQLISGAHYTDFLQPYLLFLGLGLIFDRLKKPMRDWSPWILGGSAIALSLTGHYLATLPYQGPLNQLWHGGYRAFQYAPLFAAGLLVGRYKIDWLAIKGSNKTWQIIGLILKILAIKFVADGVDWARPAMGYSRDLWKDGDIASIIGGALIGLLLFSAYSDAVALFKGRVTDALERVGKRTIISLCVQMIILPLAGLVAVHFQSQLIRATIGLSAWVVFVVMVLQWHLITAFLTKLLGIKVEPKESGIAVLRATATLEQMPHQTEDARSSERQEDRQPVPTA